MSATIASCNVASELVSWTMTRSSHWWEDVICGSFSSKQWLDNFRMSRSKFQYIGDDLSSIIDREDNRLRKAVPTNKYLCVLCRHGFLSACESGKNLCTKRSATPTRMDSYDRAHGIQ